MKLKYVFIFRHGPYQDRGFLTPEGRAQMQRLGKHLASTYRLKQESTNFICSRELRALKTSHELSLAAFNDWDGTCHHELFSNDQVCDVDAALRVTLEAAKDMKAVIVVTHSEMVEELPSYFGKWVLDKDGFPKRTVKYGEGYAIDCEKKTCVPIE
jgi:phosphohistidine phosphatase SixA